MGSTEPTASFQQGEYLSEEPTCDHRSLITLTLLKDLGGGDAADHGQYPSPWDLPLQEAGFSKMWLHLSMEKALLLTPHLFRADPGFPRPVALSALEASVEEVVSSSSSAMSMVGNSWLRRDALAHVLLEDGVVSLSHQQAAPGASAQGSVGGPHP